jgi:hypothetical protein
MFVLNCTYNYVFILLQAYMQSIRNIYMIQFKDLQEPLRIE